VTESERLLDKKKACRPTSDRPGRRCNYAAPGLLAKLRVSAHRRQTAYTPRADACQACGLCVVSCPEGVITLVPPVATD